MVYVPIWLLAISYLLVVGIAAFAIVAVVGREEGQQAPPAKPTHARDPQDDYKTDITRRQYPAPEGWVLLGFQGYMCMFREEDRLPLRQRQGVGQPMVMGLDGVKPGCAIYTLTPDRYGINIHVDRENDERPILIGTVSTRQEAIECILIDDEPYLAKREERKAEQDAINKNMERLFERK